MPKKKVSGSKKKTTVKKTSDDKVQSLIRSESKFIIAVVLVSILVFAAFIIILDASITGMVTRNAESNSNMDNVFFVMTVFGMVLFLGSMLFYYLNSKQNEVY
jgi:hypothetical protein